MSIAMELDEEALLVGPPGFKDFVPQPPPPPMELLKDDDDDDEDEDEDEELEEEMKTMGFTENGAPTFLTSGSSCLDFFYQIVPSTRSERVVELLKKAWEEDALTALKLIFHLRGVRGTGKSDKLRFYDAAAWLYKYHPRTLIANIDKVAPTGYYKDLLELVLRLVEGEAETRRRMELKEAHKLRKRKGKKNVPGPLGKRYESSDDSDYEDAVEGNAVNEGEVIAVTVVRRRVPKTTGHYSRKGLAARTAKEAGTLRPREERVAEAVEKGKQAKEAAAAERRNRRLADAHRAVSKYSSDPTFRALYNAVAKLFADALAKDMSALKSDPKNARIGLAAKWCPSLDLSYDQRTLLCEAIARKLFPKDSDAGYAKMSEEEYVLRVRDKLRKDVLVPLRKAMQLPEVYMSAQKWSELPYTRVASVAMKAYKEHFAAHDEKRFKAFLDKVESGKVKIAAGALLPHEILKSAVCDNGDEARVAELQWKQMVTDMREHGSLPSSLSICDVSGSMFGEPMEVCIALGMLTAELAEEPWKDHVITFSNNPVIHKLQGRTLANKYEFTRRMQWDMNTDFQKVFDRLLEMARASNLPPEKMVKRLFVFSDMEFDQARGQSFGYHVRAPDASWETDYKKICNKFRAAGYGEPPQIVFWNLRDSRSTPVTRDQPGVALVSGFSKNLLKMFLKNGGDINPMMAMKDALAGEIYDDMKVVD